MKLIYLIPILLFTSCLPNKTEQKMHGRWHLNIIESYDQNAEKWKVSSWMKDGAGILQYNPNGTMSVHFTPSNYLPQIISKEDELLLDNALQEMTIKSSDYWYVGDYWLSPTLDTVFHHRVMHSNPEDWGVTVARTIDIRNDTLILSSTEREVNLRLKWSRSIDN